jgi:hypothetical protein
MNTVISAICIAYNRILRHSDFNFLDLHSLHFIFKTNCIKGLLINMQNTPRIHNIIGI